MTHKEMEQYLEKVAELTLSTNERVDALVKVAILSAIRCRILQRPYSRYHDGAPPEDVLVDAAKGASLEIAILSESGYNEEALMEVANELAYMLLTHG